MQRALTVDFQGAGGGSVSFAPSGSSCAAPIDCTRSYNEGTVVTVTAAADAKSTFTGWSGVAGCTDTDQCEVTMSTARTIAATFTRQTRELSVDFAGGGGGSVSFNPVRTTCATDCTHSYDIDTPVTLTAQPNATSTFTGWTAAGCGAATTCQVTMSDARSVTATFATQTRDLNLDLLGTGGGAVSFAPSAAGLRRRLHARLRRRRRSSR